MNSDNCPAPGTLTGTAEDASKTTEKLTGVATYVSISTIVGAGPLRFSSYEEKAAYTRGKLACVGCTETPS
jgi:hypothetical protein